MEQFYSFYSYFASDCTWESSFAEGSDLFEDFAPPEGFVPSGEFAPFEEFVLFEEFAPFEESGGFVPVEGFEGFEEFEKIENLYLAAEVGFQVFA